MNGTRTSKKAALAAGLATLFAGMFVAGSHFTKADASGMPADKATATGSTVQVFAPNTDVTLLKAQLKTSTPEDLLLAVTLECSILTQVSTTGTATSSASGEVDVWVEVDGVNVPVDRHAADGGRVTFCRRDATQTVTDGDQGSTSGDTITEYLNTKAAHGFNWAAYNVNTFAGTNIHTVTVHATLTTSNTSNASAQAAVGNRSLVIEPTKLAD